MAYAEKRGSGTKTCYLARFSDGKGKWPTVKNTNGDAIRYKKKRDAEKAAEDAEAEVRGGRWHDPKAGQVLLGAYANTWYARLDLAPSTMQNYRRHLEEHILPEFEAEALSDIDASAIEAWVRKEREAGYKPSSVKTWRGTLHTLLADAVEDGVLGNNPAQQRRGRGKRAGRKKDRGPEKVFVGDLQALLIAERAALLTGRDDEFVMVVTKFATGMRWGEVLGLEPEYVRSGSLRVEAQLWEDDFGLFHHIPPKDDSYRDVDAPPWLSKLLSEHIARTSPRACSCHGRRYVFRARDTGEAEDNKLKAVDVARHAGVSVGTVSNVLNHPERVSAATRERVEAAVAELGFGAGRGGPVPTQDAAHWRRSGFATWVFGPAASGWYPRKAPQPERPVPLEGEPFPGRPLRGRNSQGRADFCWAPIARGLTPHGLRHSHRTALEEMGIPPVLIDERIGHEDGSVQRRYTHVTPVMRERLVEDLTARWEAALDARFAMCPRSPVSVLDGLLGVRAQKREVGRSEDRPTEFPQKSVSALRSRPPKRA